MIIETKLNNKIIKLEQKMENVRHQLEEMPSRRKRASLNVLYDSYLSKKTKLEGYLNNKHDIRIYFSGGCLFAYCETCKKYIASEEVDFPGRPDQRKLPLLKLEEAKKNHFKPL